MSQDNKMPNDRELDLLASIGSKITNMDTYENKVLRDAELQSAPRLSGLGLPELPTLTPSAVSISDVPHVQKLLTKVRSQIHKADDDNVKLFFKEQILLTFLQRFAKDGVFVHPQEEARQEIRRRKRLLQGTNDPPAVVPASIDPLVGWKPSINNSKAASKKRSVPDEKPKKELTASERLEMIKNNKRVMFADNVTAPPPTLKRPRVSIMKRKEATQQPALDEDIEKQKEYLKRLRKEREDRRRQRRKRWMPNDDGDDELEFENAPMTELSAEEKKEEEQEDDNNSKVPLREGVEHGPHDKSSEPQLQSDAEQLPRSQQSDERGGGLDTATQQSEDATDDKQPLVPEDKMGADTSVTEEVVEVAPSKLACPLCNGQVAIPAGAPQSEADAILSQHMEICQNSRTRGQRRSTRARAIKSYAEADHDIDEPVSRRSTRARSKTNDNGASESTPPEAPNVSIAERENDIFEIGEDDVDDDEELEADAKVDESGDELRASRPRRSNSKPSIPRRPTPPVTPLAIDDLDESAYEDRVDDWVENGIRNMRDMKERDTTETPPGEEVYEGGLVVPAWINDRLFPYQRTGLQWMWELHRQEAGGIIGDEMGLGKTVQISGFLGAMASSRKLRSVLIISPATMLQHWLKELAKWAPGLRRILIHQSGEVDGRSRTITLQLLQQVDSWSKEARRSRLFEAIDDEDLETRDASSFCGTAYAFVTTYENVRRSPEIWTSQRWSYVVMDEAQKIRNPDADVTLACKRLRTPHRLALSGTPIQNDLRELWSLFDFVFPGRLGTLPAFENEFAFPIKKGGYSNASPMQVQLAYRCALVLRDLINPYLLRRQKKDVKEVNRMPGKTEQVLFCRLSDRQRSIYESFLQSDQVKGVMRGSTQLLAAITMLRKICNHPDLICHPGEASFDSFVMNGFQNQDVNDFSDDDGSVSEEESMIERSGKMEVLAKILPLWKEQGHRVLIFCQWKKMLNIIQRFTELQGWKFGRLDGNTNVASRQRLVDNFNTDLSYFGMLCTTRTGGVGLNLTGADRIILYDPDWNPQTDAQARERAWRFGQEREVTIYRLIAAGTVEEKIYQRQIFKTALSNRILQDPRQRRLFSQKDLRDLFTLKADSGSVISGGEGMTETGELTKGAGYIDPDSETVDNATDDGETMKTVLKSKGLAGVFDHHVVEKNESSKTTAVKEMEAKASRIAQQAISALQESVADHDKFTPTWTGSAETESRRFGDSTAMGGKFGIPSGGFGAADSVGVRRPQAGSGRSSSSLLASLRQRNEEIATGGAPNNSGTKTKEYTDLLLRIRTFVRRRIPTSDEILDEFSSVPNYDAAVFRRLLKSVARVENGKWRLRQKSDV